MSKRIKPGDLGYSIDPEEFLEQEMRLFKKIGLEKYKGRWKKRVKKTEDRMKERIEEFVKVNKYKPADEDLSPYEVEEIKALEFAMEEIEKEDKKIREEDKEEAERTKEEVIEEILKRPLTAKEIEEKEKIKERNKKERERRKEIMEKRLEFEKGKGGLDEKVFYYHKTRTKGEMLELRKKKSEAIRKKELEEEVNKEEEQKIIDRKLRKRAQALENLKKAKEAKKKLAEGLEGEGVLDFFKDKAKQAVEGIKSVFSPRLDDYNNVSKRTLRMYGNKPIQSLIIYRTPISSILDKAINLISLGKWDELKNKYGFDKLFHLALVANVGNKNIIIEKNEVVNVSTSYKTSKDTQTQAIPLTGKVFTIVEMLDTARKQVGDNTFFSYDAFTNNCQYFIKYLLEGMGLYTDSAKSFLFQDLSKIYEGLPRYVPKIAKGITTLGAIASKLSGKAKGGSKASGFIQAIMAGKNVVVPEQFERYNQEGFRTRKLRWGSDNLMIEKSINQFYEWLQDNYQNYWIGNESYFNIFQAFRDWWETLSPAERQFFPEDDPDAPAPPPDAPPFPPSAPPSAPSSGQTSEQPIVSTASTITDETGTTRSRRSGRTSRSGRTTSTTSTDVLRRLEQGELVPSRAVRRDTEERKEEIDEGERKEEIDDGEERKVEETDTEYRIRIIFPLIQFGTLTKVVANYESLSEAVEGIEGYYRARVISAGQRNDALTRLYQSLDLTPPPLIDTDETRPGGRDLLLVRLLRGEYETLPFTEGQSKELRKQIEDFIGLRAYTPSQAERIRSGEQIAGQVQTWGPFQDLYPLFLSRAGSNQIRLAEYIRALGSWRRERRGQFNETQNNILYEISRQVRDFLANSDINPRRLSQETVEDEGDEEGQGGLFNQILRRLSPAPGNYFINPRYSVATLRPSEDMIEIEAEEIEPEEIRRRRRAIGRPFILRGGQPPVPEELEEEILEDEEEDIRSMLEEESEEEERYRRPERPSSYLPTALLQESFRVGDMLRERQRLQEERERLMRAEREKRMFGKGKVYLDEHYPISEYKKFRKLEIGFRKLAHITEERDPVQSLGYRRMADDIYETIGCLNVSGRECKEAKKNEKGEYIYPPDGYRLLDKSHIDKDKDTFDRIVKGLSINSFQLIQQADDTIKKAFEDPSVPESVKKPDELSGRYRELEYWLGRNPDYELAPKKIVRKLGDLKPFSAPTYYDEELEEEARAGETSAPIPVAPRAVPGLAPVSTEPPKPKKEKSKPVAFAPSVPMTLERMKELGLVGEEEPPTIKKPSPKPSPEPPALAPEPGRAMGRSEMTAEQIREIEGTTTEAERRTTKKEEKKEPKKEEKKREKREMGYKAPRAPRIAVEEVKIITDATEQIKKGELTPVSVLNDIVKKGLVKKYTKSISVIGNLKALYTLAYFIVKKKYGGPALIAPINKIIVPTYSKTEPGFQEYNKYLELLSNQKGITKGKSSTTILPAELPRIRFFNLNSYMCSLIDNTSLTISLIPVGKKSPKDKNILLQGLMKASITKQIPRIYNQSYQLTRISDNCINKVVQCEQHYTHKELMSFSEGPDTRIEQPLLNRHYISASLLNNSLFSYIEEARNRGQGYVFIPAEVLATIPFDSPYTYINEEPRDTYLFILPHLLRVYNYQVSVMINLIDNTFEIYTNEQGQKVVGKEDFRTFHFNVGCINLCFSFILDGIIELMTSYGFKVKTGESAIHSIKYVEPAKYDSRLYINQSIYRDNLLLNDIVSGIDTEDMSLNSYFFYMEHLNEFKFSQDSESFDLEKTGDFNKTLVTKNRALGITRAKECSGSFNFLIYYLQCFSGVLDKSAFTLYDEYEERLQNILGKALGMSRTLVRGELSNKLGFYFAINEIEEYCSINKIDISFLLDFTKADASSQFKELIAPKKLNIEDLSDSSSVYPYYSSIYTNFLSENKAGAKLIDFCNKLYEKLIVPERNEYTQTLNRFETPIPTNITNKMSIYNGTSLLGSLENIYDEIIETLKETEGSDISDRTKKNTRETRKEIEGNLESIVDLMAKCLPTSSPRETSSIPNIFRLYLLSKKLDPASFPETVNTLKLLKEEIPNLEYDIASMTLTKEETERLESEVMKEEDFDAPDKPKTAPASRGIRFLTPEEAREMSKKTLTTGLPEDKKLQVEELFNKVEKGEMTMDEARKEINIIRTEYFKGPKKEGSGKRGRKKKVGQLGSKTKLSQ